MSSVSPKDNTPRLDGSKLATVLVETVLYGVFFVLFIQALEVLYERAKARQERFLRPMSVTAVVLFITITGHWLIEITRAFDAFIQPQTASFCVNPGTLNPAVITYLNLANPKTVANSALYVTTTIVGDGFMVYRLYIVWSRNRWIIIPPVIFCVALAAAGSTITFLFSRAKSPIFQSAGPWITACFVLTFVCNLYSTALIAGRIWFANRKLSGPQTYGMTKITEILIQSAVLYSCCVLVALATYVANSNVSYVAVGANGPVIGIIFCMIVARSHRAVVSNSQASSRNRSRKAQGNHVLRTMAVKITTEVEGGSPDHHKIGHHESNIYPLTSITPTMGI